MSRYEPHQLRERFQLGAPCHALGLFVWWIPVVFCSALAAWQASALFFETRDASAVPSHSFCPYVDALSCCFLDSGTRRILCISEWPVGASC